MSNRTFDTLGTVHDLEATGIERPQAEAIAQAIGCNDEQLATKSDIERLEAQSEGIPFHSDQRSVATRLQMERRTCK